MDLQKLRCAVSLAKHLNFTRAAEENYITQPTMTAKINAVEAEVGVELFVRNSRGVRLTPEGEVFVKTAAELIASYETMVKQIRGAHLQKSSETLVLGYNSINSGSVICAIANSFRKLYPYVGLRLTKGSVSELNEYLLDGRAHIIISNHFEMKSYPMFHYERVVQTTPCVYVSRENPLSKKSVLEADDLKGERLLCSCCADQSGYSAAAGALAAAGIPYQPDSLVNNEEAIMSMVEAGLGCYPAAALFSRMIPNNVACIPLNLKVDNMEIVVAYLSPEVSEFALHIREIAQKIFEG